MRAELMWSTVELGEELTPERVFHIWCSICWFDYQKIVITEKMPVLQASTIGLKVWLENRCIISQSVVNSL